MHQSCGLIRFIFFSVNGALKEFEVDRKCYFDLTIETLFSQSLHLNHCLFHRKNINVKWKNRIVQQTK